MGQEQLYTSYSGQTHKSWLKLLGNGEVGAAWWPLAMWSMTCCVSPWEKGTQIEGAKEGPRSALCSAL